MDPPGIQSTSAANIMTSTSSFDNNVIVPSTSQRRKCIMCCIPKYLIHNKPYCKSCSEGAYECALCHRPLSDKYFITSNTTCETCIRKLKNTSSAFALNGRAINYNIAPTEQNKCDLLIFLENSRLTIIDILSKYIVGYRWSLFPAKMSSSYYHLTALTLEIRMRPEKN